MKTINTLRKKRAIRTRNKISGSQRPRVTVFRSNQYLYAQLLDRKNAKVLVASNSKPYDGVKKTEAAQKMGADFAKEVKKKKIKEVVFDKGAYKYHGRIKAFADAAREEGLNF